MQALTTNKKKQSVKKIFITDCKADKANKINPIVKWYTPNSLLQSDIKYEKILINKGKRKIKILNICLGLDTEFYTVVKRDDKDKIQSANAYIYIWQMSIGDHVFLCRNIDLIQKFFEEVKEKFIKSDNDYIYGLIANMGCEFQFIKHYVNCFNCFMIDNRTPLKMCVHDKHIIFLDVCKIANSNLKKIAENFCTTQKLTGDIDYKKPRNILTPLSNSEINYCINDVVILQEYFNYLTNMFLKNNYELPLTSTGIVRTAVKELYYNDYKNKYISKKCKLPEGLYKKIRFEIFRGGYTHSNVNLTGQILKNVVGIDLTSSYPSVMLQELYPMSTPKPWQGDFDKLLKYCDSHNIVWFATFKLKNITNKTPHSIESVDKILEFKEEKNIPKLIDKCGIIYDNGRIISANFFTVSLTNVDYDIYKMFYNFKISEITDIFYMQSAKLPNYLIKPMQYFYCKKCKLKKDGKENTPEYKNAKAFVNSFYGLTVQKLNSETITYDSFDNKFTYESKKYKDEQILSPMWGVWVTAYARKRLLTMVKKINQDAIYCDTDSIYMINYDKHKKDIDNFNKNVSGKNLGYDNVFNDIGCFDIVDGHPFTKFKTLGAKRYVKTFEKNGQEIHLVTVAGLPKKTLEKFCKENKLNIYDIFDNVMNIPFVYSQKNTTKYNDNAHTDIITDWIGNTVQMTAKSSMGIFEISFNMCVNDLYKELIKSGVETHDY